MIIGKIKVKDFPLFHFDDDVRKQHGLKLNDIISVVLGSNGVPYDCTLEEAKKYYCSDYYYDKEIDQRGGKSEGLTGSLYRYSTYVILTEKIISLTEK